MAEENRNDVYQDLRDTLTNQFTKIIETIKEEDIRKADIEESLKERSSHLEMGIDGELSYLGEETEGLSDEEKGKKLDELREKFSSDQSVYDRLTDLSYERDDILGGRTEIENIEQSLKDTVQRSVNTIVKFQESIKEAINTRKEKISALTKENEVRGTAINSNEIDAIELEVINLQNQLDITTNFLEKYGSLEALREVIAKKQEREEIGYWKDDEEKEYGYFDDMIGGENKAKAQKEPAQEEPVAQPDQKEKAKKGDGTAKEVKAKTEGAKVVEPKASEGKAEEKGTKGSDNKAKAPEGVKDSAKKEEPKVTEGKGEETAPEGPKGSDDKKAKAPESKGEESAPEGSKDSTKPETPKTPESGRIELIKFEIYKSLPSYLITTADGKEERFYPVDKKDKKYIEEGIYKKLRGKDKKELQEAFGNMQDIEKVFDRGLENVLTQFDVAHGIAKDGKASQIARFYQMFHDMSESGEMKDSLNVSYDLSKLHSADMSRADKRGLKKIAKNLDKNNMAWYVAKPKNFFARLFERVKLLGDGKESAKNIEEAAREGSVTAVETKEDEEKVDSCKKFREDMRRTAEKSEDVHSGLTEDMKKAIERNYADLYKKPDFSEEAFMEQNGLTAEQLAEIRESAVKRDVSKNVGTIMDEEAGTPAKPAEEAKVADPTEAFKPAGDLPKEDKSTDPKDAFKPAGDLPKKETPEEMADRIIAEDPNAGKEWAGKSMEEIDADLRESGFHDVADVGHEEDER